MRKNSMKNTRINGEVQRVLAEVIRAEIKDPRISPLTSVVSVEVAPDLKTCKAWISVYGDEEAQKATLEGLRSAEGFIRKELARRINQTPQNFNAKLKRNTVTQEELEHIARVLEAHYEHYFLLENGERVE